MRLVAVETSGDTAHSDQHILQAQLEERFSVTIEALLTFLEVAHKPLDETKTLRSGRPAQVIQVDRQAINPGARDHRSRSRSCISSTNPGK